MLHEPTEGTKTDYPITSRVETEGQDGDRVEHLVLHWNARFKTVAGAPLEVEASAAATALHNEILQATTMDGADPRLVTFGLRLLEQLEHMVEMR